MKEILTCAGECTVGGTVPSVFSRVKLAEDFEITTSGYIRVDATEESSMTVSLSSIDNGANGKLKSSHFDKLSRALRIQISATSSIANLTLCIAVT